MALADVGSAKLEWAKLGFSLSETSSHYKMVWKDGVWGTGELVPEPYVRLHVFATVLHYGQSIFEGQKIFQCKDGKVRIFCADRNLMRLNQSAERLGLPTLEAEQWTAAIDAVVKANIAFVPPYGSGASMYIRPLMFGSAASINLDPSSEVTMLFIVNPVGNYYASGALNPVDGVIMEEYDRAAPRGVGHAKVAGNYAADMMPAAKMKKKGYAIGLYLDPRENRFIEEFNTSNFVGISADGKRYVTPKSASILPSITNCCLEQLARDAGLEVERRPVELNELAEFGEVGAVGTAVVITAIGSLTRPSDGKCWKFGKPEILQKLHDHLRAIQTGDADDVHAWLREIPCDA